MKPAPFAYERPASLDAALALLAQPDARALAGGQSLVPLLNLRLTEAALLVDISHLPELKRIEARDGVLVVGAAVRHVDFEDGAVPPVLGGALQRIASAIAYRAVRNRGTIGGSLAHADPAADWPPALLALGATIRVRGRGCGGARSIAAAQMIVGALQTALAPGEIIEAIEIPTGATRLVHYKTCRKPGDFAESITCIARHGETTRVVISGHGQIPMLLTEAAKAVPARDEAALRQAVAADLGARGAALTDYHRQLHVAGVVRAAREFLQ